MPGKIRKKIKPIDPKIQKLMEDVLGTSPRIPVKKEMGGKVQKMNMGGQVMDTTKSMPVGMMDGGKVKKMNMGGVIPGRGGMFKGMK